ncbi:hypothetical protein CCC_02892 [Paramagnetospirillum magnetotacticum MS-1]|uniref:Uncharacterized protein n=1 Tax=Paramagnetospirillum magnetotacticum MS-1 TaxID=272627 RepID=A0A0C2YYF8_PARME|nr:hypothetical protein [Paramagnetospirillum magnetotacticum]KIM00104.1 hypothetical protein CCC_02892 [Paramagnetospirillum magnetotacticum MS-1]
MSIRAERISSMGLEEFRRHIPLALRGFDYRWIDGHCLEVGAITITVEELPPLSLSRLLSLPRLRIAFTFGEGDGAAFLAHWDRAFQRGGG